MSRLDLPLLGCAALLSTVAAAVPAEQPAQRGAAGRAIERAIPRDASDALFIERIDRDLAPTLDAFERAFGSEEAIAWMEDAPLPALALQVLVGVRQEVVGVDPLGGLGLYRTPRFEGAVGVVAVVDATRAEASLAEWFEELGAETYRDEDGAVVVAMPDGGEIRSFARDGYLYLTMPEQDSVVLPLRRQDAPSGSEPVPLRADPLAALPSSGATLAEDALYVRLRGSVRPGNTWLFMRRPLEEALEVDGLLLSFAIGEDSVRVDGRIVAPGVKLDRVVPRAARDQLEAIGDGAVLMVTAKVAPAGLWSLLAGPEGSDRHARFGELLRALQIPEAELVRALDGDAALTFHLDAERLAENLLTDPETPVGWFDASLGVTAGRSLSRSGTLERNTEIDGDPLELQVSDDTLRVHLGARSTRRSRPGLLAELRRVHGPTAFGERRLSVRVDVRRLREELERPLAMGGRLPAEQIALRQMMLGPFEQFFGMEWIYAEISPAGPLLRVTGEVRFSTRPR